MSLASFFEALFPSPVGPAGAASSPPAPALAATHPEPAQPRPAPGADVPDAVVPLVEEFEGFRSEPYRDVVGVWTIGFGSTRDAAGNPVCAATPPVSRPQAAELVKRDLHAAAEEVARDCKVSLTGNQKAALEDFAYNLGCGALRGSTLLRKLNSGDYSGAAEEFDKWDHAGGKELAGLLRRRQAETALFQRG